ncbi:MAG: septum formation inhibitor Maf [Bacteroidales bacterium]|nr:septum formation inhibitor Maf [Bacteroidales bacterium]
MNTPFHLILGSSSPRRKMLLEGTGLPFVTASIDGVNENHLPKGIDPIEIPQHLAYAKSLAYSKPLKEKELLITADTLVFSALPPDKSLPSVILGKPQSQDEAFQMLRNLSGNWHKVITGVFLRSAEAHKIACGFSDITKVLFSRLEKEEIQYYIEHYKPYDKAGAYGVQEWIGYIGIERIEGSFYNVMGFPVQKFWATLKQLNAVSFL